MKKLALIFAASISPQMALAEGRNDPFLRCNFDDSRVIVLAENGDAIDWIENETSKPAVVSVLTQHTYFATYLSSPSDEYPPETLHVYIGGYEATGGTPPQALSAILSLPTIGADSEIYLHITNGTCEEYNG